MEKAPTKMASGDWRGKLAELLAIVEGKPTPEQWARVAELLPEEEWARVMVVAGSAEGDYRIPQS